MVCLLYQDVRNIQNIQSALYLKLTPTIHLLLAFGDIQFKDINAVDTVVVAAPDCKAENITPMTEFAIIASGNAQSLKYIDSSEF